MVSLAKSASSMPPCAADRFDEMLVRLLTVCDRRFDTAPNFERWMLTVWIALSTAVIAAIALEGLSRVGLGGVVPLTAKLSGTALPSIGSAATPSEPSKGSP